MALSEFQRLKTAYQKLGERSNRVRAQIHDKVDRWLKNSIYELSKTKAALPDGLSWQIDVEPTELCISVMFFTEQQHKGDPRNDPLYRLLVKRIEKPLKQATGLYAGIDISRPRRRL